VRVGPVARLELPRHWLPRRIAHRFHSLLCASPVEMLRHSCFWSRAVVMLRRRPGAKRGESGSRAVAGKDGRYYEAGRLRRRCGSCRRSHPHLLGLPCNKAFQQFIPRLANLLFNYLQNVT
jgi:hypothetical protein